MSSKKLNSLSDLAHIKFDKLAPDQPEPLFEEGHLAKVQTLECHFSKKGRAGKVVTLIKGFEGDQQASFGPTHDACRVPGCVLRSQSAVG